MIPKPAQTAPTPITFEEAEKLIDESITKNGGTSALVDFCTATPDVLTKLRALYESGLWRVSIVPCRDGRTTRFKLS